MIKLLSVKDLDYEIKDLFTDMKHLFPDKRYDKSFIFVKDLSPNKRFNPPNKRFIDWHKRFNIKEWA